MKTESITWKGGKGRFENLVKNSQLKRGYIYFVGDYSGDGYGGLEMSQSGIIYVAVSSSTYVTFGSFDTSTLGARMSEVERILTETSGDVELLVERVEGMNEKLSTIEDGAEQNRINSISVNGENQTPSENRNLDILIPTKTSELTNDNDFQTSTDVAETIVGVSLNTSSGIITLTRKDGTSFTIDLPTEKIIKSGYYDSESEEIVLVLEDGSEIRFSASQLIDSYYADGSTIELYTDSEDGNKQKFRLSTSYKTKVDGSEQTSNKTSSVTSSSTTTQYPTALAVWNAIKNFATSVQTFTESSTRTNLESGETISTSLGKIKKWFSELKSVAFTGSYNDLSDAPKIGNLAKLEPDSTESSFTDTQKIIASPSSGEWGSTSYSKTALMLWNYIQSKISSVLGLTASSYEGTAKYLKTPIRYRDGNSNKYIEIGRIKIPTKTYVDRGITILIRGNHNTNIENTFMYLVNVSTGSSVSDIKTSIVCTMSNKNNYSKIILGEQTSTEVILYLDCTYHQYVSYSWNILNDVGNWFNATSGVVYCESATPNGGKEVTQKFSLLASSDKDGNIIDVTYSKINDTLEITDSNLSTYYDSTTQILSGIDKWIGTIVISTTNSITISAIQLTDVFNGKRLSLVGNFAPSERYAGTTTDGRFSQYLYEYRYGEWGYNNTDALKEAFEEFIYFNGIWYSKGY